MNSRHEVGAEALTEGKLLVGRIRSTKQIKMIGVVAAAAVVIVVVVKVKVVVPRLQFHLLRPALCSGDAFGGFPWPVLLLS